MCVCVSERERERELLEQVFNKRGELLLIKLFISLKHVGLGAHHTAHLSTLNVSNIDAFILIQRDGLPKRKQTPVHTPSSEQLPDTNYTFKNS